MPNQNFTTTFTVPQSPTEVYDAINNVRGWWTGEIEGDAAQVGDVFSYRYPGAHYSKQKVLELIPASKVVWNVVDADLEGTENPRVWIGTAISFEISANEKGTEVRFSHLGLVSELECYESCSSAWGFFVNGSLRRRITTGEGPATPPWA